MTKAEQHNLADELEMFANQIRENADDRRNYLPTTWAVDDWMERFRDLSQETVSSGNS